jgi:CRP/FNR family transcriptional regulator, cyclic AMP receptor protein
MSVLRGAGRPERALVLRTDAELAGSLEGPRRAHAEQASGAVVLRRPSGTWEAREDADRGRDGAGLLVLEGILVRSVGIEDRYGAELLGPGDLLQPWRHDGEQVTLPFEAAWRVLADLRLAVLDLAWLTRMAPFPEVAAALAERGLLRSRRLATMLAIAQHHRLEHRLLLLFWELADRYGRVGPDGVRLQIALTHELVSYLAAARRPSVSAALSRLEREGALSRSGDRWLLHGEPPVTPG